MNIPEKIKYYLDGKEGASSGFIHQHSEYSQYDSTASVADIAKKLSSMGVKKSAITDHGTMIGIWNFMDACSANGISGIPGVEGYVASNINEEEDESNADAIGNREHIILLPKNNTGYHAISKCVTESNYNIVGGKPIMTREMLTKWFGKGTPGHNNVIVTSACMAGVICSKILYNTIADGKKAKLEKKAGRYTSPEDEGAKALIREFEVFEKELADAKAEKDKVRKISEVKTTVQIKKAEKEDNAELLAYWTDLRAKAENAKAKLPELMKEVKSKQKRVSDARSEYAKVCASIEKYKEIMEEVERLESTKISENEAFNNAQTALNFFVETFGKENFYMEVQYHGIPEEAIAMPAVAKLARKNGIKIVAANDPHNVNKEDAEARAAIFAQKYFWKEITESEEQLYMKTDAEICEWLLKILPEDVVLEAISNVSKILDQCSVTFKKEEHYPKFKVEGMTAEQYLWRKINRGKKKVKEWTKEYEDRLNYEMDVIKSLGFIDYICIVEDFLTYGRLLGKVKLDDPRFLENPFDLMNLYNIGKDYVGEGIGPGRGSAVGSLVCYLTGITNLDPIEWNLTFERFLNKARVTMPDIDSDFAVDVRPWVIDYVRNKYGEKAVCQIMTQGFMAAKAAIKAAVRVEISKRGIDKTKQEAEYRKLMDIGDALSDCIDQFATIDGSQALLKKITDVNADAKIIMHTARLLEGKFCNIGTHAAGVIISDNDDVSDYVPMINVGGVIASQCDKDRTENSGYLKMDFLGLRNLSIITDTEREIFKNYGVRVSVDNMPFEKEVFKNIFSTGNTNNVFQFESDGMKRVLTGFEPESFNDLILLVALYRPGPLQYVESITNVKHGKEKVHYIIPEMEEILGVTYGKPCYQEQIMQIFNKVAGFSLGEADIIRRHMAKKHFEEFAAYKEQFVNGLIKRGAKPADVEKFWNELLDFASYAFNKSHAAAYAYVAYATAWLKYHYPAEYAIGCLNYESTAKIDVSLKNIVDNGVKITCPDINRAQSKFSSVDGKVMYGLSSVARLAASADAIISERDANGPFRSFENFIERTSAKKDQVENLIKAGAFDCFGYPRTYYLEYYESIMTTVKKISDKKAAIAEETDAAKLEKLNHSLEDLKASLRVEREYLGDNNSKVKLDNEKEVLGYYVSGHPLDDVDVIPEDVANIDSITRGGKILGCISEYKEARDKRGKSYCSFVCEDRTSSIRCICFNTVFETLDEGELADGKIVVLAGSMRNDSFVVEKVTKYQTKKKYAQLKVPSWDAWNNNKEKLSTYVEKDGCVLKLFINGVYYDRPGWLVSKDIEDANIIWE